MEEQPLIHNLALPKPQRSGSDYAFAFSSQRDGHHVAFLCVMDTIGSPSIAGTGRFVKRFGKKMKALVKKGSLPDMKTFRRTVRETLLAGNRQLMEMNADGKERVFGFSTCLALIHDDQLVTMKLGDCRTYHLHPQPENTACPVAVQCMGHDQNRLHQALEEEQSYVFLKNEMQELSRTLTYFWGVPNQDVAEQVLDQSTIVTSLAPGDCVLLVTDGVFIPILRSILDTSNYRLEYDQFYLEPWMLELIRSNGYLKGDLGANCRRFLPDLITTARKYMARKSRYRDDIAACAVHVE